MCSYNGRSHPFMRGLKELYLALFVLSYRLSRWRDERKVGSAIVGISLVQFIFAISLGSWIAIATGYRSDLLLWLYMAVFAAIFGANSLYFRGNNRGIAFEKRFDQFSAGKRLALGFVAIGMLAGTVVFFYFSSAAFDRAFHIVRMR